VNGPGRFDGDDLVLSVQVVPKAAVTGLAGIRNGRLVVRVSAPPVDGRANDALVACLARAFGVPRGRIDIRSGAGARRKTVVIRAPARLPDVPGLVVGRDRVRVGGS
jgi:hypothetical protein